MIRSLRSQTAADHYDRLFEKARQEGHLDKSQAPGQFYELQEGALKGLQVHYVDLPSEAKETKGTFLLIGGLRYHTEEWNANGFVDELRKRGYRVCVVDSRGQGWTHLVELFENGSEAGKSQVPSRYPKEEQADLIYELLSHLRSSGQTEGKLYVAGVSYGGWLTTYLSTLPKFKNLISKVFLLDPGFGDISHLPMAVDQGRSIYSSLRDAAVSVNPFASFWLPKTPPYEIFRKLSTDAATILTDGLGFQSTVDTGSALIMRLSYPASLRTESWVRFSGAPPSFNGIRDFDAVQNAPSILIPTEVYQAGNGGTVPHSQFEDFARRNPQLTGWHLLEGAKHNLPVDQGADLARMLDERAGGSRSGH